VRASVEKEATGARLANVQLPAFEEVPMRRTVRSLSLLAGFFTVAAVLWPVEAYAQRGRAHIRTGSVRVVRGNFYRPVYYGPFHNRYFWGAGWGPYGFHPSIWYAQYPRYRYAYDEASLRIQVTPRDAQVYVDGYYVGMVDSFDGTFQRLHLSPGEHVIEIFLEGFARSENQCCSGRERVITSDAPWNR
jgi:hypothetical protein